MNIFQVNLSWIYGSDEASIKRREERNAILAENGITVPDSADTHPTIIVDAIQLADLQAAGLAVESVTKYQLSRDNLDTTLERFEAIVNKLSRIPLEEITFNERCEVHMPGQALSTYNDTLLIEDSCTDVLQDALNSGWRIIACCPQPDSRRPDYILGRFNPDFIANGTRAKRDPKDK